MRKNRAYQSTSVNKVDWNRTNRPEEQQVVHVGLDIGKFELMSVLRWPDGSFERPWRAKNPGEIVRLVDLLFRVHESHQLTMVEYENRLTARKEISEYIAYYNTARIHSAIDYMTPVDFEKTQTKKEGRRRPK